MNDDDPASHFMIQSSHHVWSTGELPNFSVSSLAVGCEGERSEGCDRATAQRKFQANLTMKQETKLVALLNHALA